MTDPREDDGHRFRVAPARRDRPRPDRRAGQAEPASHDEELADLERGRTAALLGALGRMQLRLDLLAREQRDGLAALQASLEAIEQRLSAAEVRQEGPDGPPAASASE